MGRAGQDPGQAGQHHEGQEEVGAAGTAGPGLGKPLESILGDAAAVGVVLQRENPKAAHLLNTVDIPGIAASCHRQ